MLDCPVTTASSSDIGSLQSELEQSVEQRVDLLSSTSSDVLRDSVGLRDLNQLQVDMFRQGTNGQLSDGGSRAGSEGSGSFNYTSNNNKSNKTSTSEKKKKSSNWYNVSITVTKKEVCLWWSFV